MNRSVPPIPCSTIAARAASTAPSAPIPSAECGSVWPGANGVVPGRGPRRVSAAWLFPGTASYSA